MYVCMYVCMYIYIYISMMNISVHIAAMLKKKKKFFILKIKNK